MLKYINAGERFYADKPVFAYARGAVEFQVVLKGKARPSREDTHFPEVEAPVLWVNGPESEHGWTDLPGERSEVIVFQFHEVNQVVLRALGPKGFIYKKLLPEEVREIQKIHADLKRMMDAPISLDPLRMDRAKADLCLLALRDLPRDQLREVHEYAETKVDQAISWYRERLTQSPSVRQLAAAVHVSPVHLRRLFQHTLGRSPHAVMNEIRMENALRWLRDEHMQVSEVSARLGYSEPSAFTRAFRTWYRHPPGHARQNGGRS
ncbi:MAG: helix-turn-helix transcriptional regulator [Verrucomicrobia bacterium]|nr:helix-turn-helix transcriptional regulator [Verrucomicrobiota bacterium]MCH8512196.1 AraC family transcriptional regulator [Kiritimatiellia bacterium]